MRLVRPLRVRDFALLFLGQTVSLVGDGVYTVALAWLVYDRTDSPSALSLVGLTWSAGLAAFLLLGGVAADRVERRRLMIAADLARAAAVGAMGVLAVADVVEIWQLCMLAFVAGVGEAFFSPAVTALVPQLLAGDDLVQANALQEATRPVWLRLAGPALGGVVVGGVGAGTALIADGLSFAAGVVALTLLAPRPLPPRPAARRIREELREGLDYTRGQPWLWATLAMVAVTLLLTYGPQQVLVPYLVKEDLHRSASTYALVLAIGGLAGVAGAIAVSRRGMHARAMRSLYLLWGLASGAAAIYGVGDGLWPLIVADALVLAGSAGGMVYWPTFMQARVPGRMMGRVSSLDWLVSIGLIPVSFALAGPAGALLGARTTLLACGLLAGAIVVVVYFAVPALRADRFDSATAASTG